MHMPNIPRFGKRSDLTAMVVRNSHVETPPDGRNMPCRRRTTGFT
jgi:hypothetical protein